MLGLAQDAGLQMFQLRLVNQPDLVAVVQVPASSTFLARVSSLLAHPGHQ